MFKYNLMLILMLLCFSKNSLDEIELKDIKYITILDHENINYEFVTTKNYKIKCLESSYKIYETGNISFSEFTRTKCKKKYKNYNKKINEIESKIYENNDTILSNYLVEYSANFHKKRKEEYGEYLSKRKLKYIGKLNENKITNLVDIVNSSPITFDKFWNSKHSGKYSYLQELDSIIIRQRFESLENFSYYPTVDFQVITDSDTIIYYTNSQHSPPMPWTIWVKGKKTITYDDRINKALYEILPNKPKLNRERLNESIDSLFINFGNELE